MKKALLSVILFVASLSNLMAASGGPDVFGYIWKDSNEPNGPVYNWIDIKTKPSVFEVKLLSDDNNRGPFNMGFNFNYYWYTVSQFWVGSNGYISFNNSQLASPFPVIPSSSNPQDYIAPMAADLNFQFDTAAKCYFWTNQSLDTLIVTWEHVPFWTNVGPNSSTGSNTFQLILSNVDRSITFQYQEQLGTYVQPASFMTIGIENVSGNVGLQHSYDTYPPINYAIKYYYPANSTYQVFDASTVWNDNAETGGVFLQKNGAAFPLRTEIKNTGNQPLSPFNVQGRVVNAANSTIVVSATTSQALTPGQTQQITQSNQFLPINTGTFRYITDTQLSNDATPTNNSKVCEVIVVDTTLGPVDLGWSDQTNEGAGLNWQGGNGGAGVFVEPPFFPYKVESLSFFIVNRAPGTTFRAQLIDDDGLPSGPGTVLVDSMVDSNLIAVNAWNEIVLPQPVTLTSGGFYIGWQMEGDGISLGQDTGPPFSNHTFEVLGSTWAIYRSRETEDLMIRAKVSPVPDTTSSGSSIKEQKINPWISAPNPCHDRFYLFSKSEFNDSVNLEILDQTGRLVKLLPQMRATQNQISINIEDLANGFYFVNVIDSRGLNTIRFIKQ
jgi:hypothetical protein